MKITEVIKHLSSLIEVEGNLELTDDFSVRKNNGSFSIISNNKEL
jgi:hypothetical protein